MQWRLVDAQGTPVASTKVDDTVTASHVADGAKVRLQYSFAGETWKDVAGASVTVPGCTPLGSLTARS